jgi:hypothetical protein
MTYMNSDNNNSNGENMADFYATPSQDKGGNPNLQGNPLLAAAFIDYIGSMMTEVLHSIAGDGYLSEDTTRKMMMIHTTMRAMRASYGVGTDWSETNLKQFAINLIEQIISEEKQKLHKKLLEKGTSVVQDELAALGFSPMDVEKMMKLVSDIAHKVPHAPLASASDVAAQICADLTEEGITG